MEFVKLQDFAKLLSCTDVAKQYKVSRNSVLLSCKNGRLKGCVNTRHGWLIDPDAAKSLWEPRS